MKNNKQNLFERLFYNNKFLMVFSLLLAIIFWGIVKINYSETATRVITDVKVSLDTALVQGNDYIPFCSDDDLKVDVEVSGRSYNIDAYSLNRDDITIEATAAYVDSAGYKTLNLSARAENSDVEVVKITPSTLTIYFDRNGTETFNVEARLTNEDSVKTDEGYVAGQPVPSIANIDVSGPATILAKIKKVYFDATVDKSLLPLKTTARLDAEISYDLEHEREITFLVCKNVDAAENRPQVYIPVYREATVETTVKFINQPSYFDENPPKISISPAKVKITYNTEGTENYSTFNIGTIDFLKLENKVNTLTLAAEEVNASLLTEDVENFKVKIDLSALSSKTLDLTASNVVFLNQSEDYKYEALLENVGLDEVKVIGPAQSLEKLKAEDLQIEINVSSLTKPATKPYAVKISNISVTPADINDCWVYGAYRARVQVSAK